jgi:uncharacterized protein (TIGR00725 family)
MDPPYIAVCGAGIASGEIDGLAERTGRLMAEAGAVLVCGGLGGVMEAACRGAKSAGGTTVGILPGSRRADANRWVDIAIATGMGEMRNALVVRAADVVIAISGEFGTLSEIALALRIGTPVVGLATWDLDRSELVSAATPSEAVARALELIR